MNLDLSKENSLTYIKNILLVILGTGVLSFGTAIFLVPFDLVTGGVSGIAIVLENALGEVLPNMTVDLYITILTWLLFFMGLVFLGKHFAIKTLISTIFYPLLFSLSYNLVEYEALGGLFVLKNSEYSDIAVLLVLVFKTNGNVTEEKLFKNHTDIEQFFEATNAYEENGLMVIPNNTDVKLLFKEIVI